MKNLPTSSHAKSYAKAAAANPGSVLRLTIPDEETLAVWKIFGKTSRLRLFTPLVTLWTFLSQVLSADKSQKAAVTRTMSALNALGKRRGSHDPSAYCRARFRVPVELLRELTHMVSDRLQQLVKGNRLWHGRHVKLVDGSSVSMPDSPENRAIYSQPPTQKEGCGFPVARIVALFSLSTGALVDMVVGRLQDAELTLWMLLWDRLDPGDIVVGDRLYGQYADMCELSQRGIDIVARIDKTRKIDFRRGERLGHNDHLVTWTKPSRQFSNRFTPEQWAALPEAIQLREIRYTLKIAGLRARKIVLVTTLLDSKKYSVKELANLYGRRWEVETDFDHLKTSLGMNILSSRKPETVIRELMAYALAYNLVRTLMWEAGVRHRINPLHISLKATIQEIMAMWPYAVITPMDNMRPFYDSLLSLIGKHKIPERPGRHEPRVQKRRHKDFKYMTRPRKATTAEVIVEA